MPKLDSLRIFEVLLAVFTLRQLVARGTAAKQLFAEHSPPYDISFFKGKMARPDGVEPSASRLEVSCSIQLS